MAERRPEGNNSAVQESIAMNELGQPHQEVESRSLPPCDRGRAAWTLLLASFVFEALLWGFPLSFGVFQNYYSGLPQFKDSPYISVVGTIATGMSYLAAPVMIGLVKRFSRHRRVFIYVGWPICLLALIAGSFAKNLATLIVTQGVLYGLGFIIFYYPILDMINEYWVERRGMAYGLMCSASGVSGAVLPVCIEALLHKYGYPTTLRAIAIGLLVATGPMIPLLKGRLPESNSSGSGKTDWSFLRHPTFWKYSASNLVMGVGYFFPSLYLPSYASANGLSPTMGAILLAIMSVSQVLGQLTYGYCSDRLPVDMLAFSSMFVAAIATYTFWGLAHSIGLLVAFALLYGFFAAGFTALWGRMGMSISTEPTAAFAAFGLLNVGKGAGNILAGPLSGALLRRSDDRHGYGTQRYEVVVLFTGSCMLLSALIIGVSQLKRFVSFACDE